MPRTAVGAPRSQLWLASLRPPMATKTLNRLCTSSSIAAVSSAWRFPDSSIRSRRTSRSATTFASTRDRIAQTAECPQKQNGGLSSCTPHIRSSSRTKLLLVEPNHAPMLLTDVFHIHGKQPRRRCDGIVKCARRADIARHQRVHQVTTCSCALVSSQCWKQTLQWLASQCRHHTAAKRLLFDQVERSRRLAPSVPHRRAERCSFH